MQDKLVSNQLMIGSHYHTDDCYSYNGLVVGKKCKFPNPSGAVELLPKGYKIFQTIENKPKVRKVLK